MVCLSEYECLFLSWLSSPHSTAGTIVLFGNISSLISMLYAMPFVLLLNYSKF